ncbi:EcsC family protein [Flexithrix dorotheae]|uniref:EcsC family protein n=1 Tax=Flexithrix dorotheae TaxID=70993 RepID=UPI00036EF3D3|nr:EcsC family protein [Flexithrix dorotheae]
MSEPESKHEPTKYELEVIEQIKVKQKPAKKKFGTMLSAMKSPLKKAGNLFSKIPGMDAIIQKTNQKFLDFFQDLSKWSVDSERILSEYTKAGYSQIQSTKDISKLHLEDVEQVIGDLCKKYKTLAGEEEESSTALSLPSMPSDIIALVNLNHKAISEYATYYGFDINKEEEKLFALNILEYASCSNEGAKQEVMNRLIVKAKKMVGLDQNQSLDKPTFLDMFSTLTSSITIQLLKAKIGDVIPINGAVIGSGFNAYFTSEVCDTAEFIYKQRFLAEKYGPQIIDLTLDEEEIENLNEEEKKHKD